MAETKSRESIIYARIMAAVMTAFLIYGLLALMGMVR
jgi:hypothetical protein